MPALKVTTLGRRAKTSHSKRRCMPEAESPEMPQFMKVTRLSGKRVA